MYLVYMLPFSLVVHACVAFSTNKKGAYHHVNPVGTLANRPKQRRVRPFGKRLQTACTRTSHHLAACARVMHLLEFLLGRRFSPLTLAAKPASSGRCLPFRHFFLHLNPPLEVLKGLN